MEKALLVGSASQEYRDSGGEGLLQLLFLISDEHWGSG